MHRVFDSVVFPVCKYAANGQLSCPKRAGAHVEEGFLTKPSPADPRQPFNGVCTDKKRGLGDKGCIALSNLPVSVFDSHAIGACGERDANKPLNQTLNQTLNLEFNGGRFPHSFVVSMDDIQKNDWRETQMTICRKTSFVVFLFYKGKAPIRLQMFCEKHLVFKLMDIFEYIVPKQGHVDVFDAISFRNANFEEEPKDGSATFRVAMELISEIAAAAPSYYASEPLPFCGIKAFKLDGTPDMGQATQILYNSHKGIYTPWFELDARKQTAGGKMRILRDWGCKEPTNIVNNVARDLMTGHQKFSSTLSSGPKSIIDMECSPINALPTTDNDSFTYVVVFKDTGKSGFDLFNMANMRLRVSSSRTFEVLIGDNIVQQLQNIRCSPNAWQVIILNSSLKLGSGMSHLTLLKIAPDECIQSVSVPASQLPIDAKTRAYPTPMYSNFNIGSTHTEFGLFQCFFGWHVPNVSNYAINLAKFYKIPVSSQFMQIRNRY